MSSSFISTT